MLAKSSSCGTAAPYLRLLAPVVLSVVVAGFALFALEPFSGPAAAVVGNAEQDTEQAEGFTLGMNLGAVSYFSESWTFLDVFKMSQIGGDRDWDLSDPQELGPPLLDAAGYPIGLKRGQVVSALMCRDFGWHYEPGRYVCLYEGDGDVLMDFDAIRTTHSSDGAGTARFEFNVVPSDAGLVIRILRSEANNYVRNIRIVPAKYEDLLGKTTFHPVFLARLRPFASLRFMDWQRTNDSINIHWEDRITPEFRSQGTNRGVAIEYAIELSNTLDKDPWFCMPHAATDDYIRQFAILVRDTLDPARKIYIEYSNEVWNFIFKQAAYANGQAQAAGLSHPQWIGRRSVEIFKIWEEVFGGTDRLVRVVGTQAVNPGLTRQILSEVGPGEADAIAIAPYFSLDGLGSNWKMLRDIPIDDFLDLMEEHIDGPTQRAIREHKGVADIRGLDLMAYEGGQHLVVFNGPGHVDDRTTKRLVEANRHPRMEDLYLRYFEVWRAAGGSDFMAFSFVGKPGRFGSWGALEYMDQPAAMAPKYRALVNVANQQKGNTAPETDGEGQEKPDDGDSDDGEDDGGATT